jgi:hypothetical protein
MIFHKRSTGAMAPHVDGRPARGTGMGDDESARPVAILIEV